ncbi:hypothetical protein CJ204_09600 [Corynebacterium xerosis]|uniref:YdhG-like domain-containing protein n=1 Tax=Corynebacterium xerosis TaxID=1725 RepID=A0A2N6SXE1_9CORY|nr:DUF1801 domain-containing protein [Corynebacterium xerosis]PMC61744.1 hypothetical protein CJ204_09600 [Corynebacterium xerosis]
MQSDAATVEQYLAELDDDRREVMTALVDTIDAHLPAGFDKAMYSGMPNWVVPLATYPDGYHCTPDTPLPFLAIASQKRHISIYRMAVYADPELLDWFVAEYEALDTGRKLDMGKSCIRFRKPEHVPVELIGRLAEKVTPGQWIAFYEKSRAQGRPGTGVRESRQK